MQWPSWTKDVVLMLLGGMGTAVWFFLRRRAERTPVFENIHKAEKLLSLHKELGAAGCTISDLSNLEATLMGRAEAAKVLSASYEEEARKVRELDFDGALSQCEMNTAAAYAHQRSERRLQEVIEQFKKFYSPVEAEQFDEAQRAWREYQLKNASFLAARYDGGTIQPLIYSSALESSAVARIVELEAELKYMQDTLVPFSERDAL